MKVTEVTGTLDCFTSFAMTARKGAMTRRFVMLSGAERSRNISEILRFRFASLRMTGDAGIAMTTTPYRHCEPVGVKQSRKEFTGTFNFIIKI